MSKYPMFTPAEPEPQVPVPAPSSSHVYAFRFWKPVAFFGWAGSIRPTWRRRDR